MGKRYSERLQSMIPTLLQALRDAVAENPDIDEYDLSATVKAPILQSEIVDTTRWGIVNEVIFERELDDGGSSEYVRGSFTDGATEYQEDEPKDWSFQSVKPVLVTKTEYVVEYE